MAATIPPRDLSAYVPGWSNLKRAEAAAPRVVDELVPAAPDPITPNFWENLVTASGPGGTVPYNPRYYASREGCTWLEEQANAIGKQLGLPNPGIKLKPAFNGGPFYAPDQAMFGDTNAGDLLARISIFGEDWGKRAIEAIMRRASGSGAPASADGVPALG